MTTPRENQPMSAWLELPDGALFWLPPRCAIGREPGNDLVLPADTVSRHHAVVVTEGGSSVLSDLRSRNGTSCNGEAVQRPRTLRDGDVVGIGSVELRFRCLTAAEPGSGSAALPTRLVDRIESHACWLLLLDIEGYSGLVARLGSQAALGRVQAWIAALRPVIEGGGGTVNRYLGDAIFAYWRADRVAPGRLLTVLERCRQVQAGSPVAFRIVAHHGIVAFARSENGEELGGQEVNFLFRQEKIAKRLGRNVLFSEAAVLALGMGKEWPPAGTTSVDGFPGEFRFFSPP